MSSARAAYVRRIHQKNIQSRSWKKTMENIIAKWNVPIPRPPSGFKFIDHGIYVGEDVVDNSVIK